MQFPRVSMGSSNKKMLRQSGQGTVEYAVVFVAFLSLVIALGVYLDFLRDGTIKQHLIKGDYHNLLVKGGVLRDVFLY